MLVDKDCEILGFSRRIAFSALPFFCSGNMSTFEIELWTFTQIQHWKLGWTWGFFFVADFIFNFIWAPWFMKLLIKEFGAFNFSVQDQCLAPIDPVPFLSTPVSLANLFHCRLAMFIVLNKRFKPSTLDLYVPSCLPPLFLPWILCCHPGLGLPWPCLFTLPTTEKWAHPIFVFLPFS